MGKSKAYKRRLRKAQKKKKRLQKKAKTVIEVDQPIDAVVNSDTESFSSFGSPGSPPPTPSSNESSPSLKPSSPSYSKPPTRIDDRPMMNDRMEHVMQEKILAIKKECRRNVSAVRQFWRDKIYNEGTRGGRILKLSMQNH